MEKLLALLKEAGLEVTDDLKGKLESVWPSTDGLLTQDQVNEVVQRRLERAERTHEAELAELRGKVEKLVDPDQIESVKQEFEAKLEEAKARQLSDTKAYELKLAAAKAGATDLDYLEFLADKNGLYDRLELDEGGSLIAKDKDGKAFENGLADLLEEVKTAKPTLFSAPEPPTQKGGSDFGSGGKEKPLLGQLQEQLENAKTSLERVKLTRQIHELQTKE